MGQEIVNYEERWALDAERAAQEERLSGGTFLSTRGGVLSYGDAQMPGNQVAAIVIDSVRENTYYEGRFDPDDTMPPVCYAYGRGGDEDMFPHLSMQADLSYFKPQHIENGAVLGCQHCPRNEWGSAEQGRGKACQNRRRLTLLPAGIYSPKRGSRDFDLQLYDDPRHFAMAEQAFLKLPVTSVSAWAKYVHMLQANIRRPPHGVVTRIFLEPDPKTQYKVAFELIEAIPDELAPIVIGRHEQAMAAELSGYAPPESKTEAPRALRR